MAFCNRIASNGKVQISSMLNTVRNMSTSKLLVGGLSTSTNNQSLKDAFARFGDVVEAKIVTAKDGKRSKGFGYVKYYSDESACSAIEAMDGQVLDGRNVRVSFATKRATGFGNFGGFGGFGKGVDRFGNASDY